MARIDYNAIKDELSIILKDTDIQINFNVSIEGDILFDGYDNLVDIEIDSRAISSTSISNGTKARYSLLTVLTVWAKHFDIESAKRIRDDLISEIELVLMQNRTLNGKVDTSWLLGGQNVLAFVEDQQSFVAGGEIRMNIESEIIT